MPGAAASSAALTSRAERRGWGGRGRDRDRCRTPSSSCLGADRASGEPAGRRCDGDDGGGSLGRAGGEPRSSRRAAAGRALPRGGRGGGGSARTARAQSAPAGDGPAGTRERHGEEDAGSATSWRRRHGGGRGNLLKRRSGSRPLLPAAMGGSTGRESRVGPWVCASAWSVRTSGQGARLRSGDANVSL